MKNIADAKRIVFKVGSSTLTYSNGKLNLHRIELLVRALSDLKNSGHEIVLVSSGAVSAGMGRLELEQRPSQTAEKQAVASVGQTQLMGIYEKLFSSYGHTVGQILITKEEIENPTVYTNAENTFDRLLKMNCLPIVNENDSMSCAELEFGDNDTLSAYVAKICHAGALVMLSDIDGFYDRNPREYPDARIIKEVTEITEDILAAAGGAGTSMGTGGLITKLHAAELAMANSIPMYLVSGSDMSNIYELMSGKNPGTYFGAI